MEQTDESKRKLKNKIIGTAAGAFTAASLAVGALFAAPQEILQIDQDGDDTETQATVISVGKRMEKSAGKRAKPTLVDGLRAFFLRQSAAVRGVVLLPMWCIGKAMLIMLSLVWTALAPVWQVVLGVLLNALLLLGLFMLVYKLLFPNRSLKNLLKKRNLMALTVGAVVLSVADAVCRAYWEDYTPISIYIKVGVGGVVLMLLCLRIFGKRMTKGKIPAAT